MHERTGIAAEGRQRRLCRARSPRPCKDRPLPRHIHKPGGLSFAKLHPCLREVINVPSSAGACDRVVAIMSCFYHRSGSAEKAMQLYHNHVMKTQDQEQEPECPTFSQHHQTYDLEGIDNLIFTATRPPDSAKKDVV